MSRSISVIIPCYNDSSALQSLLADLLPQCTESDQVIVVDASDDSNAVYDLCISYAIQHLRSLPCRGAQLNSGALQTSSDILWFLHADSQISSNSMESIRQTCEAHAGGYFRFQFSGSQTKLKNGLCQLINWRSRWGVPYGDQGLFFTRSAFQTAGGFKEVPLFEEVDLIKAVRRNGTFCQLPLSIGVNDRKWRKDGWIKRTILNRILATSHYFGVSEHRLARLYYRLK